MYALAEFRHSRAFYGLLERQKLVVEKRQKGNVQLDFGDAVEVPLVFRRKIGAEPPELGYVGEKRHHTAKHGAYSRIFTEIAECLLTVFQRFGIVGEEIPYVAGLEIDQKIKLERRDTLTRQRVRGDKTGLVRKHGFRIYQTDIGSGKTVFHSFFLSQRGISFVAPGTLREVNPARRSISYPVSMSAPQSETRCASEPHETSVPPQSR